MLPASHSHRGVEDVGHKQWNTQGDIGLDQVQHLQKWENRHCRGDYRKFNCNSRGKIKVDGATKLISCVVLDFSPARKSTDGANYT